MTKLELAQRIQQEIESFSARRKIETTELDAGAPTRHKQIVGALELQDKRLGEERLWDWRFVDRGIIIVTTDATADFLITKDGKSVFDFLPGSFLVRRTDSTGTWMPMNHFDYETWFDYYGSVYDNLSTGQPIIVTQLPNKKIRLTPKPEASVSYTISAGYWAAPRLMLKDSDSPEFDSGLHEVLVWRTCAGLLAEFDTSPALAARIEQNLKTWNMLLTNRYTR